MKKILIITLPILGVLCILLLLAPIGSATVWKSATLTKSNAAVDVITETSKAVTEFDSKTEATDSDYDTLIKAYNNELKALTEARKQAASVGGFKGLDLTGSYQKASDTSKKLTAAYDALLTYNKGVLLGLEAEKQVHTVLVAAGQVDNAQDISAQAQKIRDTANQYQQYVQSPNVTDAERNFAIVLPKLAEALDNTSKAIAASNASQIEASIAQLEATTTELSALDEVISSSQQAQQQKLDALLADLNNATKELE